MPVSKLETVTTKAIGEDIKEIGKSLSKVQAKFRDAKKRGEPITDDGWASIIYVIRLCDIAHDKMNKTIREQILPDEDYETVIKTAVSRHNELMDKFEELKPYSKLGKLKMYGYASLKTAAKRAKTIAKTFLSSFQRVECNGT